MRVLYAVFLVCLAALLWAVWAVARTIRRHEQQSRKPPEPATLGLSKTPALRDEADEDAAS